MKKTSTRLAAIGGLLLLGACALALAQHDSRNRSRESLPIAPFASEQAEPMPIEGDWSMQVVRGNNDEQEHYTQSDRNPLREAITDRSLVTNGGSSGQISDRGLPSFPAMPDDDATHVGPSVRLPGGYADDPKLSLPRGFPSAVGPSTATETAATTDRVQATPVSGPVEGEDSAKPSVAVMGTIPAWVNSPDLPSTQQQRDQNQALPSTSPTDPPSTAKPTGNPHPTLGIPQPLLEDPAENSNRSATPNGGPPGNLTQSLSDTQRPAMPATNLLGPKTTSAAGVPALPNLDSAAGQPPVGGVTSNATPGQRSVPAGTMPSVPSLGNTAVADTPSSPQANSSYSPPSISAGTSGMSNASPTVNSPTKVAGLASNQPGSRHLDGSQNPVLVIEKRAPDEVQVGKPATVVITVQNAGKSTAYGVTVIDRVPRGASFGESIPATRPNAQGMMEWRIGELAAGATATISLKLIPEVEGELGSVATVYFAAQASVRTVATQPKLEMLLESLPDVLIGDNHQLVVTLRNVGTGSARGVRLQADIPTELRHESGDAELEAPIGDLRPNESKRIPLSVAAVQPGKSVYGIRAVTDDGVMSEKSVDVEVKSPQLVAAIEGPKLRYLERQATYRIGVKNTGTAAATNVDFVVHLPAGLKFNSASTAGVYDPNTHSVTWGLMELNSGQVAPLEVAVLPVELGPQMITFGAKADLDITAEAKQQVVVEGHAELLFTIGQDNGTIEVDASSTYSVQITNVGNKPDSNVQLAIELPPGTKLMRVDAPVDYQANGQQVVFAPVPEMRKRDQFTFSFQVQHSQPGTQIVRAKLVSGNWPKAVVKEEGTLVYNDQN